MTERARRLRKKAIRSAFLVHRWLGIGLGALMLLWCLSGMVMLWKPWPEPDQMRAVLAHDPVHFDHPPVLPRLDGNYRRFRLVMAGSIPVLQALTDKGDTLSYDLLTGHTLDISHEIGDPLALAEIARHYAASEGEATAPVFKGLRQVDQWILNTKGRDAGFYRYDFDNPRHTILYLSPLTGDVVQATTRQTRFWSWLGAIPHWLYFSQLRRHPALWADTLILLSGTGVILTTIGIWIGLRRLRVGRRFSPYRNVHLVHHMAGSMFGLFLLSWIMTGFLTMNPAGLMAHKPAPAWMAQSSGTLPVSALEETITALSHEPRPLFRNLSIVASIHGVRLVATDIQGHPNRLDQTFTPSPLTVSELVETLAGSRVRAEVTTLNADDTYYFSTRHKPRFFPVFRLIGEDGARLYLDARTGETLLQINTSEKGSRWIIYGPHDLDFFTWLRGPQARLWVILPLLCGVTLICLSGVWLGGKRCLRQRRNHDTASLDRKTPAGSGKLPRRPAGS